MPQPPVVRKFGRAYQEESRKAGRNLKLGESIGVLHAVYFGDDKAQARKLGSEGISLVFKKVFHHFGFSEAWREEGDEARYPKGKVPIPESEITIDRIERVKFAYTGTVADVRSEFDAMVENVHPEWFVWLGDQGLLPLDTVKQQIRTFGKEISAAVSRGDGAIYGELFRFCLVPDAAGRGASVSSPLGLL